MDYTLKKILEEKDRQHLNDQDFEAIFRLGSTAMADWKRGKSKSYIKMLPQIAKYFDRPISYFYEESGVKSDVESAKIHPSNEYFPAGGFITLPIIGTISAGFNGEAVEEILGEQPFLTMSLHGYRPEECFLLQVKGNSMYPDYRDKDIVLVHRQTSVDSGSVAVILYNGDEATLKKVIYKPHEDWMELIPKNPEYPVKRIEGIDLQDCRVLGKVISIVHGERN